MPNYSKNEVVLVHYPFTDLSTTKVRPAVVVSAPHALVDVMIVPLTSKTSGLSPGEFALSNWAVAGLRVPTAVKRGLATMDPSIVIKRVGNLSAIDAKQLDLSLRTWLGL